MRDKLTDLRTTMDNTVFKGQKFSDQNKRNVRNKIHKKNVKGNFIPNILTLTFVIAFLGIGAYFIVQELKLLENDKLHLAEQTKVIETITDLNTDSEVNFVEPPDNAFLVSWASDTMDRGNHDFDTISHSDLVVDPNSVGIERGDVIYFKSPEFKIPSNPDFKLPTHYIARVVGLPGETVEIVNGQVFIDRKKLDTFYSKALITGMDEEEYFEKVSPEIIENEEAIKQYFATSMDPVKVEENSIFVLVDNWSRGVDSKDFGVISFRSIKGKVLGYKK